MKTHLAPLFAPLDVNGLHLANRLAVSPMTRISATEEGHPKVRAW